MKNYYQKNPITEALKKEARKKGTPLYGAFELTSRCNFNCSMCYIHELDNREAMQSELTTEQWMKIMDDAYDHGMLFALFTGGECLLRSDFKELYLHLYNKGVIMSVNTNASLITDEYIDFFNSYRPERIQISLYGSSETNYQSSTGVRAFDKVVYAVEHLIQCNLYVEIAVTANPAMIDDYANILQFVKDHDLNYSTSTFLIPPRDSGELFQFSYDDQLHYVITRNQVFNKKIPAHEGGAVEPGGNFTDKRYGMPCNAGTIRFVVTSRGEMIPCMCIPEISISLKDNDFSKCWNYVHTEMSKVLQASKCEGCYYKKNCPTCPVVRWKDFSSGECRTKLCDLMKKEYELGLI